MNPEGEDGELTAEALLLQRAEPTWLAVDTRWFNRCPALDKRRLDWREATRRLELRLAEGEPELESRVV
jgi:hypothetical protein